MFKKIFILSLSILLINSAAFGLGVSPGERNIVIGQDIMIGEEKEFYIYIINNEEEEFSISLAADSDFIKIIEEIHFKESDKVKKINYTVAINDNISKTGNIAVIKRLGNLESNIISRVNIISNDNINKAEHIDKINTTEEQFKEMFKKTPTMEESLIVPDNETDATNNSVVNITGNSAENRIKIEHILIIILVILILIIYKKYYKE